MGLQRDTEGTIHPNAEGVRVIGECISQSVKNNTFDVPDSGVTPTLQVESEESLASGVPSLVSSE